MVKLKLVLNNGQESSAGEEAKATGVAIELTAVETAFDQSDATIADVTLHFTSLAGVNGVTMSLNGFYLTILQYRTMS